MVLKVHQNATYSLRELDGTHLKVPIAGHRVKIFRRRAGTTIPTELLLDILDNNEGDTET